MFKNLSYNRLNWIFLIVYSFSFIVSLFRLLFLSIGRTFATDLLYSFIDMMIGGAIFVSIGIYRTMSKNKNMEDELSSINNGKASDWTFLVIISVLVILLIVTSVTQFFDFTIILNRELISCIIPAIFVVRFGLYLYFERTGISNAGIDDED